MPGELRMTKDEMREGLSKGRTLTQEEWAHPQERLWVDELVTEGHATATDWRYHDNFQCEMRKVMGAGPARLIQRRPDGRGETPQEI